MLSIVWYYWQGCNKQICVYKIIPLFFKCDNRVKMYPNLLEKPLPKNWQLPLIFKSANKQQLQCSISIAVFYLLIFELAQAVSRGNTCVGKWANIPEQNDVTNKMHNCMTKLSWRSSPLIRINLRLTVETVLTNIVQDKNIVYFE